MNIGIILREFIFLPFIPVITGNDYFISTVLVPRKVKYNN